MTLKIAYTSDVHLEFGDIELLNKDNVDVLILAGDICTPHYWNKNHNATVRQMKNKQVAFFRRVSEQFPRVLYLAGNHEHYRGDVNETWNILHENLNQFPNIICGDKVVTAIDDVLFLGTTLWTDFNNNNPNTMIMARMGMNDFRLITNNDEYFLPQDAYEIHQKDKAFLLKNLGYYADVKTKIVITHHLPSFQAISPGFRDSELNGAYASDLDQFMNDWKVNYWIHGHSHPPLDMMIGDTRLLRKPRGYVGHEHSVAEDKNFKYGLLTI